MPRLSPGDKIERYTVIRPIGEGGMGEVYEARDERLQRSVALKVLRLDGDGATGDDVRLLREARLAATLVHPNVVAVYDVGEVPGSASEPRTMYLAMELVGGRPLRSHVGDASVPIATRVRWLADVARALGVAHARGIIHRDVKPENVVVGADGTAKVLDFGIAKRTERPMTADPATLSATTMEGVAIGTPYYMAPEQMRGERLDGRADQFSWGVVAYELLAGQPPWTRGTSGVQLVTEILSRDPAPVTAVEARIPVAVGLTVMRALAKSPAQRFATMDLLLASLEGDLGSYARVTEREGDLRTDTSMAKTLPSNSRGPADSGASVEDVASADTLFDSSRKPAPPVATGDVLGGRYRILGEVGRGGEGVVYRALDVHADAVVALKLLERNAERLGRYRRELQMARKVTHPNAVRIHDIVELPGRFGLSMELVEGEPLDVRIERAGPLPADDLVAMANDLAAALAAAHGAGVTHRDLKPGNVILRAGGAGAVVTDFGIARLHQAADTTSVRGATSDPSMRLTSEGALVGTPLYMAPEQLDGRTDIGPAADVYAFGLVMREAATGERLHAAATRLGELRAARRDEKPAPLASVRPDLPPRLAAVVDRCLAYDAASRFADGRALVAALHGRGVPERSLTRLWVRLAAVAAIAALGVAGALALRARHEAARTGAPAASTPAPHSTPVLHTEGAHRLTFAEGCQEFPSFSPDGETIAYDGTVGQDSYIYLMKLSDGSPHPITQVHGWDMAPAFSPDGKRISFTRSADVGAGTYVMDLDGGSLRRIGPGPMRSSWTSDGRSLWAGTRTDARLYDVETGEVRDEVLLPAGSLVSTVLEVGGKALVLVPRDREAGRNGLAVHEAGGPLRWLLEEDLQEVLTVAPHGAPFVLVSHERDTHGSELVAFPLDGGPPTSLATSGVEARAGANLSPDGKRIVWSTCSAHGGIARVQGTHLEALPGSGDWKDVAVSPIAGGDSIVLLSARSGPVQPWVIDRTQRTLPRMIPLEGTELTDLSASPDGTEIVVQSAEGLRIARLDGSAPPRMLTNEGHDLTPRFTRDGREVIFTRRLSNLQTAILAVPVEGGEPRVIVAHSGRWAVPSPVDDRIAYLAGDDTHALVPTLRDLRTGREVAAAPWLTPNQYMALTWSEDGKRLAVVSGDQEVIEIALAASRTLRTLRPDDQISDVRYIAGDLYVVRFAWTGGVWLATADWQ